MKTFTFYRITFDISQQIKEKLQFIIDGLVSESKISRSNKAYKFVGVEYDNRFVYGILVKYDPYFKDEIYDDSTSTLKDDEMPNKVESKVHFIIDYKNSVIAFQNTIVKEKLKIEIFTELFKENQNYKNRTVNLHLNKLNNSYTFYKEVENLKIIKKVSIKLNPSNPMFSDKWKSIDEDLRRRKITKYNESFENKTGESILIDEETKKKFYMSEDGYGESDALGLDQNDNEVHISTSDKKKVITLKVPDHILNDGFVVFKNFLLDKMNYIRDRIIKNGN